MTHAFAFTLRNDSSATLEVATVIAHPYSQLPELTNEKRQELSEKYENFNYYNTKKTGTATTLLSIIKEIKSSPSRIKTITTNARNPRSANIVGKFNLPNNSVNATALPFLY